MHSNVFVWANFYQTIWWVSPIIKADEESRETASGHVAKVPRLEIGAGWCPKHSESIVH